MTKLIPAIRRLDDTSDAALRALLAASGHDQRAVEIIIVALLPLAVRRCAGNAERLDELIGELAIVIGEAAGDDLPRPPRRVANVLLDRAWGRVRRPARRVNAPVATDPWDLGRLVDRRPDPADVAAGRAALAALVRTLTERRRSHAATVRAWNVAVSLAEADARSAADRLRLKYARQVLRRSFVADLVDDEVSGPVSSRECRTGHGDRHGRGGPTDPVR